MISSWRKNGSAGITTASRDDGSLERRSAVYGEAQLQKRKSNIIYGPLESHWHFSDAEKKKPAALSSKLSILSLQRSLTKISKSSTFRKMFQGNRDPAEAEKVQSFRDSLLAKGLLPEKHDDYHTLLRFLRMRNFDLFQAENMFVNMLKWRQEKNIDEIAKEFVFEEYDAVKRSYPHGYHGVDKSGRPLYIERIGFLNLDALLQITNIDRFLKYHISEQEKTLNLRYPACSLAARRHIASTTAILDVAGINTSNFSRPARELFTEIQKIDSNYYPETLHQIYIVNAGPGFRTLWKVLRLFLDVRTLLKIEVLGRKYQDKLFEAVDSSNLPEFLGGTCKCNEHGGCLLKDKGPWTDPEIKTKLMDVFNKAQSGPMDGPKDKENFEEFISIQGRSSDRRPRSHSIKVPSPRINDVTQSYPGIRSGDQIVENKKMAAEKINELEDWLVDTTEILEQLNSKHQELGEYIDQLKILVGGGGMRSITNKSQ